MQNKNFAIGMLSLTAAALAIGNYFLPDNAYGEVAIRDRDYSLVTATTNSGAEALYILDNRSGQVAVLTYDSTSRTVKPRKVRNIMDAFGPTNERGR